MLENIRKHLILPAVITLIALYLIGFRIWQNRRFIEIPVEEIAENKNEDEDEENIVSESIQNKININTANESELQYLEGIGEIIAKRITEHREQFGSFTSIEQIMEVEGIGEKVFAGIKNYITVE